MKKECPEMMVFDDHKKDALFLAGNEENAMPAGDDISVFYGFPGCRLVFIINFYDMFRIKEADQNQGDNAKHSDDTKHHMKTHAESDHCHHHRAESLNDVCDRICNSVYRRKIFAFPILCGVSNTVRKWIPQNCWRRLQIRTGA